MSYLVLARKYRPALFEDVLGQESVTRTLVNALRMGRVAHAYLFAGPRGVGKTSVARILAKALNCVEGPTPRPCGDCERCRKITAGHDIDVREIDAASNRGIDHIRELRDSVRYAPAAGQYKVYIIDEVHQLTSESFNALLKTLEEPPPHVVFIFATTELDKVPETVRSRCQIFEFRSLGTEKIAEQLTSIAAREEFTLDADVARAVARRARGSLRDAQSLLDQLVTLDGGSPSLEGLELITGSVSRDVLGRILMAALGERQGELIEISSDVCTRGASVADLFDQLLEYLRELMVVRAGAAATGLGGPDAVDLAGRLDLDRILAMMQIVLQGRSRLRDLDEHRLVLEMTLLKLSRVAGSLDLPAALSYLRRLRLGSSREIGLPKPAGEKTTPVQQARAVDRPLPDPSARPDRANPPASGAAPPLENPADAGLFYRRFLDELGCSAKGLEVFLREHFESVRVTGTKLEVRRVAGDSSNLYDLRKPKERQAVEKALVCLLGDGASLVVLDETREENRPAPGPGSAGVDARRRPAAERAREVFGGDVVEE